MSRSPFQDYSATVYDKDLRPSAHPMNRPLRLNRECVEMKDFKSGSSGTFKISCFNQITDKSYQTPIIYKRFNKDQMTLQSWASPDEIPREAYKDDIDQCFKAKQALEIYKPVADFPFKNALDTILEKMGIVLKIEFLLSSYVNVQSEGKSYWAQFEPNCSKVGRRFDFQKLLNNDFNDSSKPMSVFLLDQVKPDDESTGGSVHILLMYNYVLLFIFYTYATQNILVLDIQGCIGIEQTKILLLLTDPAIKEGKGKEGILPFTFRRTFHTLYNNITDGLLQRIKKEKIYMPEALQKFIDLLKIHFKRVKDLHTTPLLPTSPLNEVLELCKSIHRFDQPVYETAKEVELRTASESAEAEGKSPDYVAFGPRAALSSVLPKVKKRPTLFPKLEYPVIIADFLHTYFSRSREDTNIWEHNTDKNWTYSVDSSMFGHKDWWPYFFCVLDANWHINESGRWHEPLGRMFIDWTKSDSQIFNQLKAYVDFLKMKTPVAPTPAPPVVRPPVVRPPFVVSDTHETFLARYFSKKIFDSERMSCKEILNFEYIKKPFNLFTHPHWGNYFFSTNDNHWWKNDPSTRALNQVPRSHMVVNWGSSPMDIFRQMNDYYNSYFLPVSGVSVPLFSTRPRHESTGAYAASLAGVPPHPAATVVHPIVSENRWMSRTFAELGFPYPGAKSSAGNLYHATPASCGIHLFPTIHLRELAMNKLLVENLLVGNGDAFEEVKVHFNYVDPDSEFALYLVDKWKKKPVFREEFKQWVTNPPSWMSGGEGVFQKLWDMHAPGRGW